MHIAEVSDLWEKKFIAVPNRVNHLPVVEEWSNVRGKFWDRWRPFFQMPSSKLLCAKNLKKRNFHRFPQYSFILNHEVDTFMSTHCTGGPQIRRTSWEVPHRFNCQFSIFLKYTVKKKPFFNSDSLMQWYSAPYFFNFKFCLVQTYLLEIHWETFAYIPHKELTKDCNSIEYNRIVLQNRESRIQFDK